MLKGDRVTRMKVLQKLMSSSRNAQYAEGSGRMDELNLDTGWNNMWKRFFLGGPKVYKWVGFIGRQISISIGKNVATVVGS